LTSLQVRRRLIYAAMSLLVVWHTFAMVIVTSPDSAIVQSARAIVGPYVTLLRLDNNWGFFAPEVGLGEQFRYIVEDAAGTQHTFAPGAQLNRFLPSHIWFLDRYRNIMEDVDIYGDVVAAQLCRDHASLRPVSITFLEVEQKDFTAADWRSGKRPFDPEFLEVKTLKTIPCPDK